MKFSGVRRTVWYSLIIGVLLIAFVARHAWTADLDACFGSGVLRPGDYDCSLGSSGLKRTFRVHVPTGYDAARAAPVVLVFHGGGGTGRFIQRQSRMDSVADRYGFIAVYPDGRHRTWNAGACCEEAMRRNVDDVKFVDDLLTALQARLAVDARRVYATGFSNGAMLTHRLACELPHRFAAIAPVSGVIMVPECPGRNGVSVMVFHGTADPRSLWEGGLGDKDPSKGTRESIPATMDRLKSRYACAAESRVSFQRGAVTCTTRPQCRDDVEVTLCRVEGGGHQWPGGEPVWSDRLGPLNTDISASELMWQFFSRHARAVAPAAR